MLGYKIVRTWPDVMEKTIARGLTLEEAQAHCRDPKTHKLDSFGIPIWFDGYDNDDKKRR
jgi:hypothetical protein